MLALVAMVMMVGGGCGCIGASDVYEMYNPSLNRFIRHSTTMVAWLLCGLFLDSTSVCGVCLCGFIIVVGLCR